MAFLFSLGALPGCANAVLVAPGHRAVVMVPSGGMAVADEGISAVDPDAVVDDFDMTEQSKGGRLEAITLDGVPLVLGDPIVNYGFIPNEIIEADRTVGSDAWTTVVRPIVGRTIAAVLSSYRLDQLTPDGIRDAETRITTLSRESLKRYHVALSSVSLKGISASLPEWAKTVSDTSVWEQRSIEAKSGIEIARQEADALRAKAEGIAAAYHSIGPELSRGVLDDKKEKAWQSLIASPTTTVLISNDSSSLLETAP